MKATLPVVHKDDGMEARKLVRKLGGLVHQVIIVIIIVTI
jgi:hypothetical protein